MSTPVTRGELREELKQLRQELKQELKQELVHLATKAELAQMATKADLAQLASQMATKAELAQLASQMATKADLAQLASQMATKAELAQLATKADLNIWGGALFERLLTELARHTKAIQETLSTQVSTFDDKYADLPGRVSRLEAAVFVPKQR